MKEKKQKNNEPKIQDRDYHIKVRQRNGKGKNGTAKCQLCQGLSFFWIKGSYRPVIISKQLKTKEKRDMHGPMMRLTRSRIMTYPVLYTSDAKK